MHSFAFECGFESYGPDDFKDEYVIEDIMMDLNFCGDPFKYAKAAMMLASYDLLNDFTLRTLQLNIMHQGYPRLYQIGDEWNRKIVNDADFKKSYRNVFKINDGSGVYIKTIEIDGESFGVVATNQHVVEGIDCEHTSISNRNENKSCLKIINLKQKEIDIAFIITNPSFGLDNLNINIQKDIHNHFYTAGYGSYLNDERQLKDETSNLCQRFYTTEHSVKTGCDVSSGDSGSPVFLKDSGELYGLINATSVYNFYYTDRELVSMFEDEKYKTIIKNQSSEFIPFYEITQNLDAIIASIDLFSHTVLYKLGLIPNK